MFQVSVSITREMQELPVNSPTLPVNQGIVHSPKAFSDGLTLDLTDEEITRFLQITLPIRQRWSSTFRSKLRHNNFTVEEAFKLLDEFEDELVYELATKMDLLVSVNVEPVLEGEPPIIDILGALPSHSSAQYGLDHEKKSWEVKRAKERGEDFLGVTRLPE